MDMSNEALIALIDRVIVLDADFKAAKADADAAKGDIKKLGLGVYEGNLGVVTVSQNKDSEVFDAAGAFEYLIEKLGDAVSPQQLAGIRRKFTSTKSGNINLIAKPKVVKIAKVPA
jgi:hypothetical protein